MSALITVRAAATWESTRRPSALVVAGANRAPSALMRASGTTSWLPAP